MYKTCYFVGCAFVTFCSLESAEKAQRALHGNKVLPGVRLYAVFEFYISYNIHSVSIRFCVLPKDPGFSRAHCAVVCFVH